MLCVKFCSEKNVKVISSNHCKLVKSPIHPKTHLTAPVSYNNVFLQILECYQV